MRRAHSLIPPGVEVTVKYAEMVDGETPHHHSPELAASLHPSNQHLEYTWAKKEREGW